MEQLIQPISENLWWIIPGKLAGVRKPAPEEIAELQAAGVGAIVSVMDDPANLDANSQVEWREAQMTFLQTLAGG